MCGGDEEGLAREQEVVACEVVVLAQDRSGDAVAEGEGGDCVVGVAEGVDCVMGACGLVLGRGKLLWKLEWGRRVWWRDVFGGGGSGDDGWRWRKVGGWWVEAHGSRGVVGFRFLGSGSHPAVSSGGLPGALTKRAIA